ncbi:MAG TPA: class I SAM-dependent methyltransferase [Chitinophagaceae bacterium]|nr:class I SAM-dependent methyltransferase [Chitinophagaceae bacterium]
MDKARHNAEVYNQYVHEYIDKFMDLGLYRDTFDHLLSVLPKEAKVLELGCGPGNVIKYMSSCRPDLHFLGIDLAPEMIRAAQSHNPQAQFRVMDIREAGSIKEQFDAVIAAFCIPYLTADDLPVFFAYLCDLTLSKGLLYVSCMEGVPERSGFEKTSFTGNHEMYISYYSRSTIEDLIERNNFDIEKFYTKDYPESDGSFTTELAYVARKYL